MKKKYLFWSALVILVIPILFGCSSQQEAVVAQIETPELVSFEQIGKGALFGGGDEGFVELQAIIRSQEDWSSLKLQMDAVNDVSAEFRDQDVDFNGEMIIVCIDKLRESGGYEISIVDILEDEEKMVIIIEHVSPSEMATSVLTQPFHVVKITKSEKKIIFKEKE